jgi:hypothetical protein
MRGIIDPQTRIGTEIHRRMGEGLSTIDRTILSIKSVVYRACQTKQRTSSKGRTHERLSVSRRSCEAGNPPRKNLVSEPRGSRDSLSAERARCEEPPPNIRPVKAGNLCSLTCTRKSCQKGMYSARHLKKHARGAHPSLLSTSALFGVVYAQLFACRTALTISLLRC